MAKLKGEVYCPLCTDGKGNAKKVATVKADTKAELDQKANAARREHHARVHPNWPEGPPATRRPRDLTLTARC